MPPSLISLIILFVAYFGIQFVGNALKLAAGQDRGRMQTISFGASMFSHAFLIIASLAVALLFSLDFRVGLPSPLPDIVLLVLGLVIYLFVFLLDIYLRLVMRHRQPTTILDVDEQYIISPPSPTAWELALFNFVLLKGFAYEIFLRGFALTTLTALTDNPALAICIVAVIEFLLRPHGERLVPTIIASVMLSVIYYATSGLIVTIIIRVVGNYFLSLYMVYLTFKGNGEKKT